MDGKASERVERVFSSAAPPRLLSDGCGCVRSKEGDDWVVTLCDRHAREAALDRRVLRFMLG